MSGGTESVAERTGLALETAPRPSRTKAPPLEDARAPAPRAGGR